MRNATPDAGLAALFAEDLDAPDAGAPAGSGGDAPEVEEWRDVVGREGEYEVSSFGHVRSHYRGGRVLKARLNGKREHSGDYYCVDLGRLERRYVHHLVAEAFIGPRPDGLLVCHENGDRHSNRASNLYYGTHAENHADARRHNTYRSPVDWAARRAARDAAFAGSLL